MKYIKYDSGMCITIEKVSGGYTITVSEASSGICLLVEHYLSAKEAIETYWGMNCSLPSTKEVV